MSLAVDGAAGAQLNQLLDEALELAPEQRLHWLETLDVSPALLKDQLRSLLAGSALAEDFLSTLPPIGNAEQTGAQHQQDTQQDLRVVVDILKRTVGAAYPLTIAASGKLDVLQLRTAARTPLQGLVGRH